MPVETPARACRAVQEETNMRFCYAHRRFTLYPQSVNSWDLSSENYSDEFLTKVKDTGFDALEIGMEVFSKLGTEQKVRDFASRLGDFGLLVGCVRSGGTLHDAKNGPRNRERLDEAIPAFITLLTIPMTFSIAHGIGYGVLSYVAIKLLTGRCREVGAVLSAVAVVFAVYLAYER